MLLASAVHTLHSDRPVAPIMLEHAAKPVRVTASDRTMDLVQRGRDFFGQPSAFAADMMSIIATQAANLAERQLDLLVDPIRNSGLPPMLSPLAGEQHAVQGDAYSALLLYAGSRTEAVYAAAIRSRMAACHPGFSGMWARDYERVHELLGRARPANGSRLQRAMRFNRLVHITVAKRLVPSGGSLRRDSGNQASVTTDAERDLLDWFFLTERALVCRHGFADALTHRTSLALTDLATYPMSARYGREEIDRFQAELSGHLEPPPRLAALALSARGRDDTAITH